MMTQKFFFEMANELTIHEPSQTLDNAIMNYLEDMVFNGDGVKYHVDINYYTIGDKKLYSIVNPEGYTVIPFIKIIPLDELKAEIAETHKDSNLTEVDINTLCDNIPTHAVEWRDDRIESQLEYLIQNKDTAGFQQLSNVDTIQSNESIIQKQKRSVLSQLVFAIQNKDTGEFYDIDHTIG